MSKIKMETDQIQLPFLFNYRTTFVEYQKNEVGGI
jgi:hypothetical protein